MHRAKFGGNRTAHVGVRVQNVMFFTGRLPGALPVLFLHWAEGLIFRCLPLTAKLLTGPEKHWKVK